MNHDRCLKNTGHYESLLQKGQSNLQNGGGGQALGEADFPGECQSGPKAEPASGLIKFVTPELSPGVSEKV